MKRFLACCLAIAVIISCNSVAFAAETSTPVYDINVTESTAVPYSTTYLYQSGYCNYNILQYDFTVPSSGNVTMIYGASGTASAGITVTNLDNGNMIFSTNFSANGKSQVATRKFSSGNYRVMLILDNPGFSYALNFYR